MMVQRNIAMSASRIQYGEQLVVSVKQTGVVMTVASSLAIVLIHALTLVSRQMIVMVQQQTTVLHVF
jgi:hypothetical protein